MSLQYRRFLSCSPLFLVIHFSVTFLCSPNNGMIGITEPRRVAAVSMSKRVATEMNLQQRSVKN